MTTEPLPTLAFATVDALEAHLAAVGPTDRGFWLKLAKKGAPVSTITKAEGIEAALCFGWIDGQLGRFDADYFVIRMTPRRSGSRWSAVNRETAERLIRDRRMRPDGRAQIALAKANGRWESAYLSQGRAEVPADLAAAIAGNAAASRLFDTLDGANRYALIYRVNDVKRPATRARKIADYVAMLARGETLHAPRKKTSSTN